MNTNITRCGGDNYWDKYNTSKDGESISFNVPKTLSHSQNVPLDQSKVLRAFLNYLPKEDHYFTVLEFEGQRYRWIERNESSLVSRIASAVCSFIYPSGKTYFELTPVYVSDEDNTYRIVNIDPSTLLSEISEADSLRGIHEKIPLSSYDFMSCDQFDDPYTKLATLAFQKYETNYNISQFEKCTTRLVEMDGNLALVEGNNENISNRETVQKYYQEMVKNYGQDKVRYIEHLYKIDFASMIENNRPLTPEHVFRMNMGLTNVEIQDIKQFYEKLQTISKAESPASQDQLIQELLCKHEIKALMSMMKNDHMKSASERAEWLSKNFSQIPFEALSASQTEKLMHALTISPEARDRSLTGRAIQGLIVGWYNDDPLTEYKPWLDQQHLIQSFEEYQNSNNWPAFFEVLSFVIVKMHLIREHPDEGYRVGALIPAPKDPNGTQHWYKVTSCVSSGTFSYTLEGVGIDSPLPPIKLYRSTSASPYCMHGKESVKNDLNPFNSPGYLGKGLGDAYEESFFQERSIPCWMGYALDAEKRLKEQPGNIDAAIDSLRKANQAIVSNGTRDCRLKGMKEVLRSHDSVLLDILHSSLGVSHLLPKIPFISRQPSTDFPGVLDDLTQKYIRSSASVDPQVMKQDAKKLCDMLYTRLNEGGLPENHVEGIKLLIKDLEDHILASEELQRQFDREKEKVKEKYAYLNQFDAQIQSALEPESKRKIAEDWLAALNDQAFKEKEHPLQKQNQDLVVLGHSLGASCAQINVHHFLTSKERIPLPGHKAIMHAYDGPGINVEDNQAFKNFGNTHSELLRDLGSAFQIHHSQEAGDFVAFGGEQHLGSTTRQGEVEELGKWMVCQTEVYERLQTSVHRVVRDSSTAHATRFQCGQENVDYKKTTLDPYLQGIVDEGVAPKAKEMKSNIWKMGYLTSGLDESFRVWSNNAMLYAIKDDAEAKRVKERTDSRGVLAVDETGVVSQRTTSGQTIS